MAAQALLIIDMQQGLFSIPREGADELVARLNALAARCRAAGVPVIFVRNAGPKETISILRSRAMRCIAIW